MRPGEISWWLEITLTEVDLPQRDMESEQGRKLIEVGEVGIGAGDEKMLDDYFNQEEYVFHGPQGEQDYPTTKAFFAAMRETLEGYNCTRHDLIVKDDFIAARTQMSGRFAKPFKGTPFGDIQPNGKDVKLELINFFRYDEDGKLAEEWVQCDFLGFYEQLGLKLVPQSG